MNMIYILLILLWTLLFCIVFYGLIIGGILGFLYLLMGVFNLGF